MKNIQICALGGTIAMSPSSNSEGVLPSLTSDDLLAAIPELHGYAHFTTHTLAKVGSANLNYDHASHIIDYAEKAEACGADGIVFTQGTDTLEEMSFIIWLMWSGTIPIVFTAAMRHPASVGADGPANLLASVQAACQLESGVYVVMNGEVHDPSFVQKCHTSALNAFSSECGPLGFVVDGDVKMSRSLTVSPRYDKSKLKTPYRVALITPAWADSPWQLEAAINHNFDGLVIAAYGGGHVSEIWSDALRPVAKKIPTILASRVGRGRVLTSTYGYKGAEIDLISAGLIPAGRFDACKARVFLSLQKSLDIQGIKQDLAVI